MDQQNTQFRDIVFFSILGPVACQNCGGEDQAKQGALGLARSNHSCCSLEDNDDGDVDDDGEDGGGDDDDGGDQAPIITGRQWTNIQNSLVMM